MPNTKNHARNKHVENNHEEGYVYILTNPSFRDNWIKIGKTSRPVNVRSRELNTPAIPLPFEIYATMKTSKYSAVEKILHKLLGKIAGKRINPKKEFFNIKPEEALEVFETIATILGNDVEILRNNPEVAVPPITTEPEEENRKTNSSNPTGATRIKDKTVDLPKGAKFSYDGQHFYSMAEFVPSLVTSYAQNHRLNFKDIKKTFPDEWIKGKFFRLGFVVKLEDIVNSKLSESSKVKSYRYKDNDFIFESKDHIRYCVSNQWMRETFRNIINFTLQNNYPMWYK